MALNGVTAGLKAGFYSSVCWLLSSGSFRSVCIGHSPTHWQKSLMPKSPRTVPTKTAVFWLGVGLIVLPVSSTFLVDGAITIASILHVTDTVIGLTIVALGTSLPELATAITAALAQGRRSCHRQYYWLQYFQPARCSGYRCCYSPG